MKKTIRLLAAILLLTACTGNEKDYDATGTFEATETTVSAEETGPLLRFDVNEGDTLHQGAEVGLIDTTQLTLQLRQTGAARAVYAAQQPDMAAQLAATGEQLAKARRELQRYSELVADGAVPAKTADDARSEVSVLEKRMAALHSTLTVQTATLARQQRTTDTQAAQLRDRLRKCRVKAPLSGTVLEKYAEPGEFVTVGRPLFKMADTQRMFLRAYVTSAQLSRVRLGARVKVVADYGDGHTRSYNGTVAWISQAGEFTPKTILTDDERADLVYAVKIALRNDGLVKIGMYGKVKLTD